VTLDPNGLFYAGSRRLKSLSAGDYLEGLPVGFNFGVLVGPGVVLRSCGRRSSDGRRPLRVLLILILILIILAREIIFVREGELLPGPRRAVLVDGLDDNRGTGRGGAPLLLARGALVGRRRLPLVAVSLLTSAVGRRRPPFVASLSSTLAASATVVVRRRRPQLAT
jgi:hypothetical protein